MKDNTVSRIREGKDKYVLSYFAFVSVIEKSNEIHTEGISLDEAKSRLHDLCEG